MRNVAVVFRGKISKPVSNALEELKTRIEAHSGVTRIVRYWDKVKDGEITVLAGEAKEALIELVLVQNGIKPLAGTETVSLHYCALDKGRRGLVISGGDEKGLMYAIYEAAERVKCGGISALSEKIHVDEKPGNKVRGVDRYMMNHLDNEWFQSPEFWDYFLGNMARNRFNRFTLITGFDTAYMTPPYPFFVEIPSFENVRVKGLTPEAREKNLEALNVLAKKCGEYGILFSFATWQQLPWTDNQESGVENIPDDPDEFTRCCTSGLRKLLESCPGIGALQFRVNHEAGVSTKKKDIVRGVEPASNSGTDTDEEFWYAMFDVLASLEQPPKLDMRAKGVTDAMVKYALGKGLDVSIPTKYWCEHAALPYHISKLRSQEIRRPNNMNSSRRYSYGDLLKKPRSYDMIYRLWNYGSINLFLWADPDYCSRFSKSARMGDGAGFEINSPLSLKGGMEKYAVAPWFIHKDPSLRTYKWEDERYWAYYIAFGRWGYSPDTAREIIEREFIFRFGDNGGEILKAYEKASKVLPFITTINFPVHPSLHFWPEMNSGACLFIKNNASDRYTEVDYGISLPSDEELFYSISQYADAEISGDFKAKYSPLETRNDLHRMAEEIHVQLRNAGCTAESKGEKLAVWVDFSMIAFLADFHSWKTLSAYCLYVYQKKKNKDDLTRSYEAMLNALSNWESLSRIGTEYYNEDLQFNAGNGSLRNKNWEYRIGLEINKDISDLESMLKDAGENPGRIKRELSNAWYSVRDYSGLVIKAEVPESWNKNEDLPLRASVENSGELKEIYLNYRHADHTEGEYQHLSMTGNGNVYEAKIPGSYFTRGFDVIVYFSALDKKNRAVIFPGVNNAKYPAPYFVINAGLSGA